MGSSLPPAASIDLIDSFARLKDADVEIVLAEPELAQGEEGVTLQLMKGRQRVATTVRVVHHDDGKRQVVACAPRADLTDGTWSLTLETIGSDRAQRLDARLLVQGERPVVLLWGADGKASMLPVKHSLPSPSQRAAALGGAMLDRGLHVLPPDRAASVRTRARSIVRRVMP